LGIAIPLLAAVIKLENEEAEKDSIHVAQIALVNAVFFFFCICKRRCAEIFLKQYQTI
jgi:hypothetical protein